MKRLRLPALAADEVQRVLAAPGIRRVANRAERLIRPHRPLAVVARERQPRGVDIRLTAHFMAQRTTPTNRHRYDNTSRISVAK